MHQAPQLREECEHPPIALRRGDHRVLLDIAYDGLLNDTRSAASLLDEVSRADLLTDDGPSMTAALWSRVLFRSQGMTSARWITLVPPEASVDSTAQVSVLSPLGSALIGLSKGQRIRHPDRLGGEIRVTVLDILPPEPARGRQA